jgi:hypothetical protein
MRERFIGFAAVSAFLAGITVFAQSPAQQKGSTGAMATDTIVGCLKSNTEAGKKAFTLDGRPGVAERSPSAPAEAGQVPLPAPNEAAPNSLYTLATTSPNVNLAEHDGQRVLLTGRLQMAAGMMPKGTTGVTGAQTPANTPPPMPGGAHNSFEVSSVKMLSAKCE